MTAERFALVKTSGMGAFQGKRSEFAPSLLFLGCGIFYLVTKAGPLSIGRIKFRVIEFTGFRAPPCFGGKSPQDARPTAFGVFKSIGMQAGEKIGDG